MISRPPGSSSKVPELPVLELLLLQLVRSRSLRCGCFLGPLMGRELCEGGGPEPVLTGTTCHVKGSAERLFRDEWKKCSYVSHITISRGNHKKAKQRIAM